jgi:two-component system phosphate regulon response regulator PhoB
MRYPAVTAARYPPSRGHAHPRTGSTLPAASAHPHTPGVHRAPAADERIPMSAHILVVDDEPDISALVAYHLTRESYRVRTVASGPEAIHAVEVERPDLIVLDLMLPGMSGLQVLEELRRRPESHDVPVILLTARREEQDRIAGLRLGADDYVAKPFSPQELTLRVGAVLRRVLQAPPAVQGGKVVRVGPFAVDTGAAHAEVSGRALDLTPTEYRLLLTLMERRGRVQSRKQLLAAVWEVTANIATRTVDMHVQRLRNKVGDGAEWIETVRGFGYRFRTDPPR